MEMEVEMVKNVVEMVEMVQVVEEEVVEISSPLPDYIVLG